MVSHLANLFPRGVGIVSARAMPATPAWPPRSLPRLFVQHAISASHDLVLEGKAAHYLGNVLRLAEGAEVLLFDGLTGEWKGSVADVSRKRMHVRVVGQVRPLEKLPALTLAFAPIKRGPLEWLVEKATELGVATLQPVITQRTVIDRINPERLRLIAIEAAEQCGRTRLPFLAEPMKLEALLQERSETLLFADETGGRPMMEAVIAGETTILIGPEGGFTPGERQGILASGAMGVSLGPRILRAETAALAAVSLYMAACGDWR